MRNQRADATTLPHAHVDLAPFIEASAAARAALEKAQRNRSERPERMRALKAKLSDAEYSRDTLQAQADAGSDIDFGKLAALDVAVKSAEAEVQNAVRGGHADAVAIDVLRSRVNDAHKALCDAMAPRLSVARSLAQSKYAQSIQLLRDATTILSKIDDETLSFRIKVPDIEAGANTYAITPPSPEVVDRLLEFDAAIRERDRAISAVIRS